MDDVPDTAKPVRYPKPPNTAAGLPIGIALGAGIGTALGVAMNNIALGIGMGVGIGTALGIAWSARPPGPGSPQPPEQA